MRRARVVAFVSIVVFSCGLVCAGRGGALRQPSLQEVLLMTKGGVAYDVVIERVRRMPEVAALDAEAIATLISRGVPDQVLLELVHQRNAAAPCELPERSVEVGEVLAHPAILGVLRQVDAGVATHLIVERVGRLKSVPVLDARAITRLTSKGVPDVALLELVRKQEIRPGCDPVRAELLAAVREVKKDSASHPKRKPSQRKEAKSLVTRAPVIKPAPKPGRPEKVKSPKILASRVPPAKAPDSGLRRTARKEFPWVPPAPRAPAPDGGEQAKTEARSMGRIRVVAKSSLPVTYLEVLLDGDSVTRKGEVQKGETTPGWMLPPAPVLDVKRGAVVFESELPVGPHEVRTSFALSEIVETDWDAAKEVRGQRYATTSAGPVGENGTVPVCEIRAGRTCVVFARLLKRGDAYAVEYESKMR